MALTASAIRNTALRLLLPMILINITVGNQLWTIGPIYVGQVFFWLAILCAGAVAMVSFGGSRWPWLLLAAIPALRLAGAVTGSSATDALYLAATNCLFLLAGLVVAMERPEMVYRQLRGFLLLCLPLMVLQVAGAGEWTQVLNTEYYVTDEGFALQKKVYPTLFVPLDELQYSVGQGRPAGLLHANNVLSLVIIFAFALQLARIRSPKLTWTDLLLAATMVLAMAKVVILSVLLMLSWVAVRGDALRRARVARIGLATLVLYGIYAMFFPGLFQLQLSPFKIMYSFAVRLADIAAVLSDDASRAAVLEFLSDAPRYDYLSEEDVGHLSGYAAVIRYAPILLLASLAVAPLLVVGLRRLGAAAPRLQTAALLTGIAVVVFPAAVPFFRAQLYWFVFGFAALPLVLVIAPDVFARARRRMATRPGLAW